MSGITANRLVELIYPAWCSGNTSVQATFVIVVPPKISYAEFSKAGDVGTVKTQQINVGIDWKTHGWDHASMTGRLSFLVKLNGWPIGAIVAQYASNIKLDFSWAVEPLSGVTATPNGPTNYQSQTMLEVTREVAARIIQHEDLKKYVAPQPISESPKVDAVLMELKNGKWTDETPILNKMVEEKLAFNQYYDAILAYMKINEKKQEEFKKLYDNPYITNYNKTETVTLKTVPPPYQQKPASSHWSGSTVESRQLRLFPGLNTLVRCPECDGEWLLYKLIQHLNDNVHNWPRTAAEAKPGQQNIADWLEQWSITTGVSLEMREDDYSNRA